MLVFAIETSCDETSVCIMDKNRHIYSHIVHSQEIHKKHGGVVPELAAREHLNVLQEITEKAFSESNISLRDINTFAATCGPGLIGPLLIGSTYAKSLAIGNNKPFIPINHIEAHILSPTYNNKITYPHLSFLLTGGHTQIYLLENKEDISLIGETVDDALGETFDKVAKLLKLKYPGGPQIELSAKLGNELAYKLPMPMLNQENLNMSFSGLKTAVSILVKKNKPNNKIICDICASFQLCITNILIGKLTKALNLLNDKSINISSLSVVGGVSNNKYITNKIRTFLRNENIDLYLPHKEMMSDNAAMIAWSCLNKKKLNEDIFFKPNPRLKI